MLVTAQDTTQPVRHPGRVWLGIGTSVVGYGGSLVALSNVWYKHYPQTSFHFYNDNNDWLQMDKAGHFFSAYTAGKFTMEAWRWAGLPRKQRIWIGGLSGAAFLTVIEILDGFSQGWGFSTGDMFANLTGSAAFISQELLWDEQRIGLKFSFHLRDYGDPQLNERARQLFGSRSLEKLFKDYNAQTYWVSVNLKSFWKKSDLPRWLNVAVGYGADGMFGGSQNIGKDANGNIFFDRTDIPRYRQWYLAPDIDLTRIRTKKKWLKTSLFLLNALKFPTPSVGFSKKGIEWSWIHF
jgi:uncharacterized protein YfiM (DUF2279 family)